MAKKTTSKKPAAKKPAAKKPAAKKAPAKKPAAKKTAVKKTTAKKPAAKKTAAKKPAVKKAPTKKPAAKKAAVSKAPAKKAAVKKPAVKTASAKKDSKWVSADEYCENLSKSGVPVLKSSGTNKKSAAKLSNDELAALYIQESRFEDLHELCKKMLEQEGTKDSPVWLERLNQAKSHLG